MNKQQEKPDPVRSEEVSPTERALSVLELLARTGSVSAMDLMATLPIPKTTAHRIIGNLEEFGYLRKGVERGRYLAAPRLLGMATGIIQSSLYQVAVHAVLEDVCHRLQETCVLSVLQGDQQIIVDSAVHDSPLRIVFDAGKGHPLYCTPGGRVSLAHMDKRVFTNYLRSCALPKYTKDTIVDPDRLAELVRDVRKQGYAVVDSEWVEGTTAVAVPVSSQNGKLLASLTVMAPEVRKSVSDMRDMVPMLHDAAARIQEILRECGPLAEEGELLFSAA